MNWKRNAITKISFNFNDSVALSISNIIDDHENLIDFNSLNN